MSKGLLKWDQRLRIGIHVGLSLSYDVNVILVLNIFLGYVLPKFHVVFNTSITLTS